MKIVLPGGSGQVGTLLARAFVAEGHEVVVLSRSPTSAPWQTVIWDARTSGEWVKTLDGADVVINLAGRSVNCRYTPENRRAIIDSRVQSTVAVRDAILRVAHPPRVWLQSSTATIYAHRFDAPNDDDTGIIGGTEADVPETWRFSIDVAQQWEAAATAVPLPTTRTVLLRSAMTMSPDRDGIFDTLLRLVRFGLGGTASDGRQYISWIHGSDFIRAVLWCIDHDISGPLIVAAPEPLPNAQFMRVLREAWGTSVGLPASRWMLEVGAVLMQTETELILKSRRVVPSRLLADGFVFQYPHWKGAAEELCARWRGAGG